MAWNPSVHAMHVEARFDPDDAHPGSILVEHFNDPYEVELDGDTQASLRKAAHAYLADLLKVSDLSVRLRIPSGWVDALDPAASDAQASVFGWLPSERTPGHQHRVIGPYGSFRFESPSDTLVALFASQRLGPMHHTGSGFGLALIAHVRPRDGKHFASFAGLSGTLPFGNYLAHPITPDRVQPHGTWLAPLLSVESLYRNQAVLGAMAAAANLKQFVVRGIRLAASDARLWIERQGVGVRVEHGVAVPYLVSMLSTADAQSHSDTITHVAPLVADANGNGQPPHPHPHGHARVFDGDPSSVRGSLVRPTWNGLDAERVTARMFDGANSAPLRYPAAGAALVQVMPSPRYVAADRLLPPADPRPVTINTPGSPPENNLPVRSDDASALQAFFHARDLVERIRAYGWAQPADYFRITSPDIRIFYRSGISPGPGKDGRTVNARVIPEGWPADAIGRLPNDTTRPAVQIHLGWADLRRREPGPTLGGLPSQAVPFGVAADKRWMWHEFGHVLLVTSSGELEFRFAHSPGDAMAAIAADPESTLPARLRTLTFPFVFVPRQHNRCATDGWSWSGSMHAALRDVPAARHPRRKGYWSEQILSSSLFRLYRCIGGDTGTPGPANDPEAHERHRASHYCLYLIMQAMQLMGDVRTQVISTPAQFVRLLRDADRQNGQWVATFPGRPAYRRMGGTASKVIRWAFQAQGLYGSGNGPGLPEPVDIYIQDQRPTTDTDIYGHAQYGPGSYVPVSLHWPPRIVGDQAGGPSLWHAHPQQGVVHRSDSGQVEVLVRNRGSGDPNTITVTATVELWFAAWPSDTDPPLWDATDNAWTQCAAVGSATQVVRWDAPQTFTFDFDPGAGRYILFAQATCNDDHANTDPAAALACSSLPTPLADLVANDNNLGLRVVELPAA